MSRRQRQTREYQNREKFHELADELQREDPKKYKKIIKNLRDFEYDDVESELFAHPKAQMFDDFMELGRNDIAKRVMDGEFNQ
jgi:hypothetical protein